MFNLKQEFPKHIAGGMPIRSVPITEAVLTSVSSVIQRNVTETGRGAADCSMLKCSVLQHKFRHWHSKVTAWWANLGSSTSLCSLHLLLLFLLWLLVSIQVHPPSHPSAGIYHLGSKPDWGTDPAVKIPCPKTVLTAPCKERKTQGEGKKGNPEKNKKEKKNKRESPSARAVFQSQFTAQLLKWLS